MSIPGRPLLNSLSAARASLVKPLLSPVASANNSLYFNDEDEEEGEVTGKAPVKGNDADNNEGRIDDKDTGPLTKDELSAFHQKHFEFISKYKLNL